MRLNATQRLPLIGRLFGRNDGRRSGGRRNGGQRSSRRSSGQKRSLNGKSANGQVDQSSVPKQIVVCTPPQDRGRTHELSDRLVIGRGSDCDVILDDGYSSNQHASIYKRGDQYLLEDLGSSNGTYVNRQRIVNAVVVHPGDQIQIGTTVFEARV